jgi:DNA-binding transcriptional MerR regulator
LDKAPEAFRTISEVADDLDIPQHVLRFWETRFAQIKPMKRSGGRRYYRPDDVDLLRGIRRLLYGEGYTIRGVQRILREQGIKAVQGLSDAATVPPSAVTDRRQTPPEDDEDEVLEAEVDAAEPDDDGFEDDEDGEDAGDEGEEDETLPVARERPATRPPEVAFAADQRREPTMPRYANAGLSGGSRDGLGGDSFAGGAERLSTADTAKLKAALDDLVACKKLVEDALKEAPPEIFPVK